MTSTPFNFSLRHRLLICLLTAGLVILGARTLSILPIDAFPDTTPVQVQINTTAAALNPQETEAQITIPVELAVSGLTGLQNVRSISKFGLSQVVATFDDTIDIFKARQLIMERLQTVEMAEGLERPQLGPIATGLGEVFHYVVRSTDTNRTPTELRVLQDWVVKTELRKVPGVAEVNTWGGFEKQYRGGGNRPADQIPADVQRVEEPPPYIRMMLVPLKGRLLRWKWIPPSSSRRRD